MTSEQLDQDEIEDIVNSLRKKWSDLNEEYQRKAHKRFMSAATAKKQEELDQEMKRIERILLRFNYDLVYYFTK